MLNDKQLEKLLRRLTTQTEDIITTLIKLRIFNNTEYRRQIDSYIEQLRTNTSLIKQYA